MDGPQAFVSLQVRIRTPLSTKAAMSVATVLQCLLDVESIGAKYHTILECQ